MPNSGRLGWSDGKHRFAFRPPHRTVVVLVEHGLGGMAEVETEGTDIAPFRCERGGGERVPEAVFRPGSLLPEHHGCVTGTFSELQTFRGDMDVTQLLAIRALEADHFQDFVGRERVFQYLAGHRQFVGHAEVEGDVGQGELVESAG